MQMMMDFMHASCKITLWSCDKRLYLCEKSEFLAFCQSDKRTNPSPDHQRIKFISVILALDLFNSPLGTSPAASRRSPALSFSDYSTVLCTVASSNIEVKVKAICTR